MTSLKAEPLPRTDSIVSSCQGKKGGLILTPYDTYADGRDNGLERCGIPPPDAQ